MVSEDMLGWIRAFLGSRSRQVVIDGRSRNQYQSHLVFPRARCWDRFHVYINDLPDEVRSQVRLFADDTALYLIITMESEDNSSALQNAIDILSTWESRWDMEFNPSKCQVVHATGSKGTVKKTIHVLHGQVLESVTSARYLGVDVSSNLSWKTHVDRITGNANRILALLDGI